MKKRLEKRSESKPLRLTLHRETVRHLDDRELTPAKGGLGVIGPTSWTDPQFSAAC